MEVNPRDLWTLLLCTIRYSMGRMPYMTSYAPEMVQKYKSVLQKEQLEQIKKEVIDELKIEENHPGYMGHSCDVANWHHFVKWLEKEIKDD